jgi:hypothetical protein
MLRMDGLSQQHARMSAGARLKACHRDLEAFVGAVLTPGPGYRERLI